MKVLISSCLLGINTQWDEDCKKVDELVELIKSGRAIFMCPEQLGGLSTPREPSEIEQGKTAKDVLSGKGVTAELLSQNRIKVYNEENFPKDLLDES